MRNGTAADAWKTMLAILSVILSIFVALFVLQVTQLWTWINPLTRHVAAWPVMQPHVEIYRMGRVQWGEAEARMRALEVRELDLDGRFARLEEEHRQLEAAEKDVKAEQARLALWERQLDEWQARLGEQEADLKALEDLRQVYAAMRPREAAAILEDMQEAEVALILKDMAPRQASGILAAMSPEKAATVSRELGL